VGTTRVRVSSPNAEERREEEGQLEAGRAFGSETILIRVASNGSQDNVPEEPDQSARQVFENTPRACHERSSKWVSALTPL
jgi:hypothetical protein